MPSGIYIRTEEHKKKISQTMKGKKPKNFELFHKKSHERIYTTGKDAAHWKGNKIGYQGVHQWLRRNYGQPKECEWCNGKNAKRFEWANIYHSFKRDRADYIRLCKSCHSKYDHPKNRTNEVLKYI